MYFLEYFHNNFFQFSTGEFLEFFSICLQATKKGWRHHKYVTFRILLSCLLPSCFDKSQNIDDFFYILSDHKNGRKNRKKKSQLTKTLLLKDEGFRFIFIVLLITETWTIPRKSAYAILTLNAKGLQKKRVT
jgi:hypothetical protein